MKLFKYINHKKVSIEVFDPCYTLDKIKHKKIKIYCFKKIDNYHYTFITHNKNISLLKEIFKSLNIQKNIGFLNIINNNILRISTIISIICSLLSFYFMNTLIMDVKVSSDASSLESLVISKLNDLNIKKYQKRKSNEELLKIEKEIAIELYDSVEWIEIKNQGLNVYVKFLKRRETFENKNSKKAIYATKSGIIKNFNIEKGIKVVNINDYVSCGQLLIDGYLNTNNDKVQFVGAKGSVYAYTWFNLSLSVETKGMEDINVYETLINEANSQVDKELTGDDEYIENEKIINFSIKDGIGKLVIHYTLVEDITR